MPDEYVMLIVEDASGLTWKENGKFLRSYDPDGAGGFGAIDFTADPGQAMTFADQMDGFALWKKQSTVMPLRDDGRPNRPLSAYTITMVELMTAARVYAETLRKHAAEKAPRDAR